MKRELIFSSKNEEPDDSAEGPPELHSETESVLQSHALDDESQPVSPIVLRDALFAGGAGTSNSDGIVTQRRVSRREYTGQEPSTPGPPKKRISGAAPDVNKVLILKSPKKGDKDSPRALTLEVVKPTRFCAKLISQLVAWCFIVACLTALGLLIFFFCSNRLNISHFESLRIVGILMATSIGINILQVLIFKICLLIHNPKVVTTARSVRFLLLAIGIMHLIQQIGRIWVYYFLSGYDLMIQCTLNLICFILSPLICLRSDGIMPFHRYPVHTDFTFYWIFFLVVSLGHYVPKVVKWDITAKASDIFFEYHQTVIPIFLGVLFGILVMTCVLLVLAKNIKNGVKPFRVERGFKPLDLRTQISISCIFICSGAILVVNDYVCYVIAGLFLNSFSVVSQYLSAILSTLIFAGFNLYLISYVDRIRGIMQIQLYQVLFNLFIGLVLFSHAFKFMNKSTWIDIFLCVLVLVLICIRVGGGFLFENVTTGMPEKSSDEKQ